VVIGRQIAPVLTYNLITNQERAMTHDEIIKLPINQLLAKAAEVIDDILDPIADADTKPEWTAMLLALRERSKDVFGGTDAFAAKDIFDPGVGG
jgi:hypothetical protein